MPEGLHLTVITPARAVYDEDAKGVVVPAFDGALGVLKGHAPLMALLGSGPLKITEPDGTEKNLAVRGGFLQVTRDKVTVLTPEAAEAGEIKSDELDAELEEVEGEKATSEAAVEAKAQKIAWVKARRTVLERTAS